MSQTAPVDIKKSVKQFEANPEVASEDNGNNLVNSSLPSDTSDSSDSSQAYDILLAVLAVILILALCVFFYIRARDKMAALVGEQPDFSDDETPLSACLYMTR